MNTQNKANGQEEAKLSATIFDDGLNERESSINSAINPWPDNPRPDSSPAVDASTVFNDATKPNADYPQQLHLATPRRALKQQHPDLVTLLRWWENIQTFIKPIFRLILRPVNAWWWKRANNATNTADPETNKSVNKSGQSLLYYPTWWWWPMVRFWLSPIKWLMRQSVRQFVQAGERYAPRTVWDEWAMRGLVSSVHQSARVWAKLHRFYGMFFGRMRANGYDGFWHRAENFWDSLMLEWRRVLSLFLSLVVGGVILGMAALVLVVAVVWPTLPNLERITRYEPVLPLQVLSSEGQIISEFGSEHRTYTPYDQFPKHLVQAIVAAEDQRFFTHAGFDPVGIIRAMLSAVNTGTARSGASTITQQLALNFYFERGDSLVEKIERKIKEILLSIKLERELTKEKILEVYMNQIYLGERAFGFTSAAKTYFDKEVGALTIGEAAILAGLPKFPSVNPVTRPERVLERRPYTLRRMFEDGYITADQRDTAAKETLPKYGARPSIRRATFGESSHVAEMARQYLIDLLRAQGVANPEELAYSRGFRVTTTLRINWQEKAIRALRQGLINVELENGFRAPEKHITIPEGGDEAQKKRAYEEAFDGVAFDHALIPALLFRREGANLHFYMQGGETFSVDTNKNAALKKLIDLPQGNRNALIEGAVVRVFVDEKSKTSRDKNGQNRTTTERIHHLTQLPKIEGALVSLDPNNGKVLALVGGYAFSTNKFNHATQAWRQPGSTFKPFIYSAAVDRGLGAGDVLEDEPLIFEIPGTKNWEPKNYDGTYSGPMSIRRAVALSKNSIVAQVLANIGVDYAHQYLDRFGFDTRKIPAVMSLALGSGEVTPMQMATAYGAFANGGYRVQPWLIAEVRDSNGKLYYQYVEESAKKPDNLVLDPRNAFIMDSMLKDVMRSGTAARAGGELKRSDLAGKTGTTNEYVDAWFCGYQPNIVSVVWVGYDQPQRIGRSATGGKIALPIWIDFMKTALEKIPEINREEPADIGRFNNDLILKEFEKSSSSPSETPPWENWGVDPNHDYESEENRGRQGQGQGTSPQPFIPGDNGQPIPAPKENNTQGVLPPIRFF